MKRQKQSLGDLATQFFAIVQLGKANGFHRRTRGGAPNQPRTGVGPPPMSGSLRLDYPAEERSPKKYLPVDVGVPASMWRWLS
jgi:hypothetical protein